MQMQRQMQRQIQIQRQTIKRTPTASVLNMNLSHLDIVECYKDESKYLFNWIVRDFNCRLASNSSLPSVAFKVNLSKDIFLAGTLSLLGDHCTRRCLQLLLTNRTSKPWKAQCKVYYGNGKSVIWNLSEINTVNTLPLYTKENEPTFQQSIFAPVNPVQPYANECHMQSGNHVITCEISHEKNVLTPGPTIATAHLTKFVQDFAQLFESKQFWDVTFEVADQKFHAHKSILACRSPVFSAMFENQMKEATTNEVLIEDIEPEVFQEVLRFIYTENALNLKQIGAKLLAASDKYDLTRLRSMCEKVLAAEISVDNAAEILITADLHRAAELKGIAKIFIRNNKKAVAATKGWQEILENSHLLAEMFLEIV